MEDCWRFPDRAGPGQVPLKRLRSDFDDLAPPTSAYFPREEPRFDERDGRLAWTEPESLGMGYGPGLGGNDISTTGRLGLSGHGSLNLGRSTHDDIGLSGQGHILGSDKASDIERNEYFPRQANPLPRMGAPGLPSSDGSTTLFVEGLPSDCSKREVAHVFRPFLGFKEVRLVRKDAKRPGGDQVVLCFVDFTDMRSAATAMEALQGYKFDETNHDSDSLRFQFARALTPRGGGGGRDDFRGGRDRDDFPRGGGRPFRH